MSLILTSWCSAINQSFLIRCTAAGVSPEGGGGRGREETGIRCYTVHGVCVREEVVLARNFVEGAMKFESICCF